MTRLVYLGWALITGLALWASLVYPGRWFIYALFTVTANALLYFGFRRDSIFFDAFIGVFFWLGFWMKLSVRVVFFDATFNYAGHFDGSPDAFDRALLVASCGFVGLLLARAVRTAFFRYPERLTEQPEKGLFAFYAMYRKSVIVAFVVLVAVIAASNLYLGVYQRGAIPRTVLPYGLSGVYSWLLLFGLASAAAVIAHLELRLRRETSYTALAVSLIEGFSSSVSLLSRGMVLNTGALGYGVLRALKPQAVRTKVRFWVVSVVAFALVFAGSVLVVNYARMYSPGASPPQLGEVRSMTEQLFIERWVGMEGVMAVSSHPQQGWDLWREALQEVPVRGLSFYDSRIISSPYAHKDFSKHNFISLPGVVAFLFYPGSFVFLVAAMFLFGVVAAVVEVMVFRLGGKNLILCALIAQVVASRYVHFGYVPRQTYLLFGAVYLNVLLIYLADKGLAYWQGIRRV